MNAFSIKDIENLSGIKAHTIRIWEQRYHFLKPQRSSTNIRSYNNEELRVILNVALLNRFGFKISQIDKMELAEMESRILSLPQQKAQRERLVHELIQSMAVVDMDDFENTLENFISSFGIENAILQIIFPFLEKIGMLWMTNHINPAQEHLVTNIIRQKMILAIESLHTDLAANKLVVLYLPEGEYHELGLIHLHYLLKRKGIRVLYLGANLPVKDLAYLVDIKRPQYIFTHLTSVIHGFNFEKYFDSLSSQLPGALFIISGQMTNQYKKKLPENIIFKKSIAEMMEFIAAL